jgi:hypothetical protein
MIPPPAAEGFVGLDSPRYRQSEAQHRRTMIVQGLLGAGACTFVLGLFPPLRFFLVFFVLDLVAFAGYVFLLIQWKNNRLEQGRKVRALPARRVATAAPWYPSFERQAR